MKRIKIVDYNDFCLRSGVLECLCGIIFTVRSREYRDQNLRRSSYAVIRENIGFLLLICEYFCLVRFRFDVARIYGLKFVLIRIEQIIKRNSFAASCNGVTVSNMTEFIYIIVIISGADNCLCAVKIAFKIVFSVFIKFAGRTV